MFSISLIVTLSLSLIGAALCTLRAKDLISAVILYGIFSLNIVILYVLMSALDIAITEVTVGSAMSAIFAIIVVGFVGKSLNRGIDSISKYRIIVQFTFAIICILFVLSLVDCVAVMKLFGHANDAIIYNAASYYIQHSMQHFHSPNIVTSILAGYRGFDTLLETTVIFIAAVGIRSIK